MINIMKCSLLCATVIFATLSFPVARAQESASLRIASGPLAMEFNARQGRLTITDSRTGRKWTSLPAEGVTVISARQAGPSQIAIVLRENGSQAEFNCSISVQPD